MKKYNVIILGILMISLVKGYSQDETDAFRYSQLISSGTARSSALAGSMGGFGADFSSVSANPAGLGVYKRNEFTFSPVLYYSKASSVYNNSESYDFKFNFNVGNLGAVFAFPINQSGWKYIQFATGFNRLNNYHNRYIIKGNNNGLTVNTKVTLTDYFAELGNDIADSMLTDIPGWAYYTWLIDPDTNNPLANQYMSHIGDLDLSQRKIMETSGSSNEYVFSMAANYNDKIYIGATIGIPFFSYFQTSTYSETLEKGMESTTDFRSFSMKETLTSEGTGVNLKLGILYQPFKFIRFGVALHTPTFYNNIEEYYTSYFHTEGYNKDDYEMNYKFNYSLTTPYKILGDLAFIIGKHGFINLSYKFTDYSVMQLHSRIYDFDIENSNIRTYYQAVHSLGIGGELNLSPVSLRLGYAYNSNPYKTEVNNDGSYHLIAGGIGVRSDYFYTDFAYVYRLYNNKSVLFDDPNISITDSKIISQYFVLTFGLKI